MLRLGNIAAVWLAATAAATAQETAKPGYLGVVTTPAREEGEVVRGIDPQGPAAAAGVKPGDVILRIDNQPINSANSLRHFMDAKKPAQIVALAVRDASGNVTTKSVTLRDLPQRSFYSGFDDVGRLIAQAQFLQPPFGPPPRLGIRIQNIDPDMRQRLKLGDLQGVLISEVNPNTPAAEAKLQANDVIQAVDGKPATSAPELQNLVANAKAGAPIKLKVFRNGQSMDVPVTVKALPTPNFPPGMGGMPGMAPPGDLVNQVNELRRRVEALESRLRALEQRGANPPPAVPPPKGPGNPPPPGR